MWSLLHLCTKLELGGAQLATLHEVQHSGFCDGGRVLAFGPGGLLDEQARMLPHVEARPLRFLRRELSPLADLAAVLETAVLVWRLRRQWGGRLLVHTHSSKAGVVGRLGAFLGGADCIVHSIHGFGHPHHGAGAARRVLLLAERFAARVTDGFTADSAANIEQGLAQGILHGKPARVVRCAIDVHRFATSAKSRQQMREELGVAQDAFVVVNVSCLKPQKDPLTFARVAAGLLVEVPRAHFLLAGDGELRAALEHELVRLGIRERVSLLGWRRDVPELLQASDVLALTSRWEGLPQVLPQAMAAGLPIVATRVDGNPEAVRDGDNGYLKDPGDVAGFVEALARLAGDEMLRRRMAENGRGRAEEFSNARMLAALDDFYRELTAAAATAKRRAQRRQATPQAR